MGRMRPSTRQPSPSNSFKSYDSDEHEHKAPESYKKDDSHDDYNAEVMEVEDSATNQINVIDTELQALADGTGHETNAPWNLGPMEQVDLQANHVSLSRDNQLDVDLRFSPLIDPLVNTNTFEYNAIHSEASQILMDNNNMCLDGIHSEVDGLHDRIEQLQLPLEMDRRSHAHADIDSFKNQVNNRRPRRDLHEALRDIDKNGLNEASNQTQQTIEIAARDLRAETYNQIHNFIQPQDEFNERIHEYVASEPRDDPGLEFPFTRFAHAERFACPYRINAQSFMLSEAS